MLRTALLGPQKRSVRPEAYCVKYSGNPLLCHPSFCPTQAEYCRVPHADGSLHPLPAGGLDAGEACMFCDVYPTSFECACLHGA